MKCYSKIDLLRAYNQLPVNPCDVPKTAVTTPFGLFEYLFTPYGLRNAGSTFQRFMDNIFMNFNNCFIYIDDILIFSENESDHIQHLNTVFRILDENNLRISIDKCEFLKESIDFLGCNVSVNGIKPTANKQNEIINFPVPEDSKSLRRFLGICLLYTSPSTRDKRQSRMPSSA